MRCQQRSPRRGTRIIDAVEAVMSRSSSLGGGSAALRGSVAAGAK